MTQLTPGLVLPLGDPTYPAPGYLMLLAIWAIFGTLAAGALAFGVAVLCEEKELGERAGRDLARVADGRWLLVVSLFALAGAVAVRLGVLHGAAVTDDETSYRFAAQLIASGRLWVPSLPMKLHFDHPFMINDGRYQSMYFLGWPALAAPGAWLGLVGYMNALYFALGVPAVFLVARRLWGSSWAKAASILFASSPYLLVLAGTELSHTTCMGALAWATWFLLRSRDEDAGWAAHAGFATCLSIAFWIRPLSAVGLGGVLVATWLLDRRRRGMRARDLIAFALPAVLLAGLLLVVQDILHGSPWRTGYAHGFAYHLANHLRFTPWTPDMLRSSDIQLSAPWAAFTKTGGGVLRLGLDLFGWPIGLLALAAAIGARNSRLPWAILGGGLLEVFFQKQNGVNSFGPLHWSELALPVTWLVIAGARSTQDSLRSLAGRAQISAAWRWAPASGLFSLIVVSWIGFVPVRWATLVNIVRRIRAPEALVERTVHEPAVIFSSRPFTGCDAEPPRLFRFFAPVNDPDFRNRILWANHVSFQSDRELMHYFPGRKGYLLVWKPGCIPGLQLLGNESDGARTGSGAAENSPHGREHE